MTWFDLLCQEHPGWASLIILAVFIGLFWLMFIFDLPGKFLDWWLDRDDDDNDKPSSPGSYNIFDY